MERWIVGSVGATLALVIAASCGGKGGSSIYNPNQGGAGGMITGGGDAGAVGLGVGDPCSADHQCRPGLACTDGTCQPGHDTAAGEDCILSAECQDGLFCADGLCAPAGSGMGGDECTSDADCASGFRCALDGFSATCVEEGMVDLGGSCSASTDCFAGLGCVDGACAQLPPGTPPFGLPFAGVECAEPDAAGAKALFRIPRANDQNDFFQLPFPNDVRREGTSLNLADFPTPGDALLGFDPVARYVDAVEATADGWGMYQGVLMRFSGRLKSDTLLQPGTVALVDLTDGIAHGLYWSYAIGRSKYICHNRIVIRRAEGLTFVPGHTYAAYVTTLIQADDGSDVERPADLVGLLADNPPNDVAVLDHWAKYSPFRQYLTDHSIDRDTVLNAAVFRVGNPRREMDQVGAVLAGMPVPAATNWTRCDDGVTSPCPDATGTRACPSADADFDELHALVALPVFQEGTAPYLQPGDGGAIHTISGVPTLVRTESVCMSLTVPKGSAPVGGFPTVIYAHGTGGSFRSHVIGGVAKAFAQGVDDGQGTVVRAAVLGIDQVQHGPRRNGSAASPSDLFFNFENPAAAKGNPQQGAIDQLALFRFVPSIGFTTGSPTGVPFALSSSVAFWGQSQGATHGGIATPYANWAGVVFSGQGGSLKDALTTKTSPTNIAGIMPFVLGDFDGMGKLPHGRHHPVMELLQLFIDGGDPVAYNRILALDPVPTFEAKHVFQLYGLNDTYTPSAVQAAYAGGLGIDVAQHHSSVTTPEIVAGLEVADELALPASGNHIIGGKTVSVLLRQYAPTAASDGHFIAFDVPEANGDALRFLAGALNGVVPRVGE